MPTTRSCHWRDAVLTPHTAFLSVESLDLLQNRAGAEVARVLTGDVPVYGVNVEGVRDGMSGNGAAGPDDVALFWREV